MRVYPRCILLTAPTETVIVDAGALEVDVELCANTRDPYKTTETIEAVLNNIVTAIQVICLQTIYTLT